MNAKKRALLSFTSGRRLVLLSWEAFSEEASTSGEVERTAVEFVLHQGEVIGALQKKEAFVTFRLLSGSASFDSASSERQFCGPENPFSARRTTQLRVIFPSFFPFRISHLGGQGKERTLTVEKTSRSLTRTNFVTPRPVEDGGGEGKIG